jgi:hypothetical protein
MSAKPAKANASSFLTLPPSSEADKPHEILRNRYRAAAFGGSSASKNFRAAALGALGVALGVGGTVLGVSYTQASDRIDMYETVRQDRVRSRPQPSYAPVVQPVYVSRTPVSSYAPVRGTAPNPLAATNSAGSVIPLFNLNPFHPTGDAMRAPSSGSRKAARQRSASEEVGLDVVSGAANVPRTICVRLCDGFQHPLGYLRDSSDMPGHTALCRAMFPDVPTAVYRVAAGAETIDDAVGPDGKTYRALPMAYAYQTSIDPVCARPRSGAQTVSLLRDFTLRAGDTVVLDGRARTFNGSSSFPYTAANFTDFRRSSQLGEAARRQIDERVGISRQERLRRQAQQQMRVREASAASQIDVVTGAASTERTPVRVIDLLRR